MKDKPRQERCGDNGGLGRNGPCRQPVKPGMRCRAHSSPWLNRTDCIKGEILSLLDGETSLSEAVGRHGDVAITTLHRYMRDDPEFAMSVRESLPDNRRILGSLALHRTKDILEDDNAVPPVKLLIYLLQNHPDEAFIDRKVQQHDVTFTLADAMVELRKREILAG